MKYGPHAEHVRRKILFLHLRVARPDRNRLVHIGWLARRIDAMLWPGRIFLQSLQIFLLQKCFHQGFLISPDAMDSPGTKSSGKIVSRYLDQIVGWELENLNKFKNQNNKSICDFLCSYIHTHHLNDLHFKFSLKLFLLDTSPKSPRSGPIRS